MSLQSSDNGALSLLGNNNKQISSDYPNALSSNQSQNFNSFLSTGYSSHEVKQNQQKDDSNLQKNGESDLSQFDITNAKIKSYIPQNADQDDENIINLNQQTQDKQDNFYDSSSVYLPLQQDGDIYELQENHQTDFFYIELSDDYFHNQKDSNLNLFQDDNNIENNNQLEIQLQQTNQLPKLDYYCDNQLQEYPQQDQQSQNYCLEQYNQQQQNLYPIINDQNYDVLQKHNINMITQNEKINQQQDTIFQEGKYQQQQQKQHNKTDRITRYSKYKSDQIQQQLDNYKQNQICNQNQNTHEIKQQQLSQQYNKCNNQLTNQQRVTKELYLIKDSYQNNHKQQSHTQAEQEYQQKYTISKQDQCFEQQQDDISNQIIHFSENAYNLYQSYQGNYQQNQICQQNQNSCVIKQEKKQQLSQQYNILNNQLTNQQKLPQELYPIKDNYQNNHNLQSQPQAIYAYQQQDTISKQDYYFQQQQCDIRNQLTRGQNSLITQENIFKEYDEQSNQKQTCMTNNLWQVQPLEQKLPYSIIMKQENQQLKQNQSSKKQNRGYEIINDHAEQAINNQINNLNKNYLESNEKDDILKIDSSKILQNLTQMDRPNLYLQSSQNSYNLHYNVPDKQHTLQQIYSTQTKEHINTTSLKFVKKIKKEKPHSDLADSLRFRKIVRKEHNHQEEKIEKKTQFHNQFNFLNEQEKDQFIPKIHPDYQHFCDQNCTKLSEYLIENPDKIDKMNEYIDIICKFNEVNRQVTFLFCQYDINYLACKKKASKLDQFYCKNYILSILRSPSLIE